MPAPQGPYAPPPPAGGAYKGAPYGAPGGANQDERNLFGTSHYDEEKKDKKDKGEKGEKGKDKDKKDKKSGGTGKLLAAGAVGAIAGGVIAHEMSKQTLSRLIFFSGRLWWHFQSWRFALLKTVNGG